MHILLEALLATAGFGAADQGRAGSVVSPFMVAAEAAEHTAARHTLVGKALSPGMVGLEV